MGLTSKLHTPPDSASGNAGTLPCHRACAPPVFLPHAGQCIRRHDGASIISATGVSELPTGSPRGRFTWLPPMGAMVRSHEAGGERCCLSL